MDPSRFQSLSKEVASVLKELKEILTRKPNFAEQFHDSLEMLHALADLCTLLPATESSDNTPASVNELHKNVKSIFENGILTMNFVAKLKAKMSAGTLEDTCPVDDILSAKFPALMRPALPLLELELDGLSNYHSSICRHLSIIKNSVTSINSFLSFFHSIFILCRKNTFYGNEFTKVSTGLLEAIGMLDANSSLKTHDGTEGSQSLTDKNQYFLMFFTVLDVPFKISLKALWLLFTFPGLELEFTVLLAASNHILRVFVAAISILRDFVVILLRNICEPLKKEIVDNIEEVLQNCHRFDMTDPSNTQAGGTSTSDSSHAPVNKKTFTCLSARSMEDSHLNRKYSPGPYSVKYGKEPPRIMSVEYQDELYPSKNLDTRVLLKSSIIRPSDNLAPLTRAKGNSISVDGRREVSIVFPVELKDIMNFFADFNLRLNPKNLDVLTKSISNIKVLVQVPVPTSQKLSPNCADISALSGELKNLLFSVGCDPELYPKPLGSQACTSANNVAILRSDRSDNSWKDIIPGKLKVSIVSNNNLIPSCYDCIPKACSTPPVPFFRSGKFAIPHGPVSILMSDMNLNPQPEIFQDFTDLRYDELPPHFRQRLLKLIWRLKHRISLFSFVKVGSLFHIICQFCGSFLSLERVEEHIEQRHPGLEKAEEGDSRSNATNISVINDGIDHNHVKLNSVQSKIMHKNCEETFYHADIEPEKGKGESSFVSEITQTWPHARVADHKCPEQEEYQFKTEKLPVYEVSQPTRLQEESTPETSPPKTSASPSLLQSSHEKLRYVMESKLELMTELECNTLESVSDNLKHQINHFSIAMINFELSIVCKMCLQPVHITRIVDHFHSKSHHQSVYILGKLCPEARACVQEISDYDWQFLNHDGAFRVYKCDLCCVLFDSDLALWAQHFRSLSHRRRCQNEIKFPQDSITQWLRSVTLLRDSLEETFLSLTANQQNRIVDLIKSLKEQLNIFSVVLSEELVLFCHACESFFAENQVANHTRNRGHMGKLRQLESYLRTRIACIVGNSHVTIKNIIRHQVKYGNSTKSKIDGQGHAEAASADFQTLVQHFMELLDPPAKQDHFFDTPKTSFDGKKGCSKQTPSEQSVNVSLEIINQTQAEKQSRSVGSNTRQRNQLMATSGPFIEHHIHEVVDRSSDFVNSTLLVHPTATSFVKRSLPLIDNVMSSSTLKTSPSNDSDVNTAMSSTSLVGIPAAALMLPEPIDLDPSFADSLEMLAEQDQEAVRALVDRNKHKINVFALVHDPATVFRLECKVCQETCFAEAVESHLESPHHKQRVLPSRRRKR